MSNIILPPMSSGSKQFGWLPPAGRTPAQHEQFERIVSSMPAFQMPGYREDKGRFATWSFAKKVNGGNHIPYCWQLTGSCLKADALIRMADGSEKPIVDIREGELVVSHTGKHQPVTGTMNRQYTGDMFTFHVAGHAFPITMTGNHMVAVMKAKPSCTWRWQPDELHWVRADEIKEGDHLIIGWSREEARSETFDMLQLLKKHGANVVSDSSIGKERVRFTTTKPHNAINRFISLNKDLGRLIGLYLAEGGCIENDGRIVFSFSAEEKDLITDTLRLVQDIFGVQGKVSFANSRMTCAKVIFYSKPLVLFLKSIIPGNIYNKRVPSCCMVASNEVKAEVLRGWMDGDGYFKNKIDKSGDSNVVIQGVTVSKYLARDMSVMAMSMGMRATVSKRKARKKSKEAYDVYLSGKNATTLFPEVYEARSKGTRFSDNDTARCEFGYCRAVKKISKEHVEDLTVYDIEVNEDHSFLHNDTVLHNCVGAGGSNMLRTLVRVEIAQGDPEEYQELWWLYTYGQSRKRAGLSGQGEGSFGAAWAEAIKEDGCFSLPEGKEKGQLPDFNMVDGWLQLSRGLEMEWSDGARKNVDPWKSLGLKHPVQTVSPIRSPEEAKAALQNGYPLTLASGFGTNTIRPRGNPSVNIAEYDDNWPHQMYIDEAWDHPSEGLIFRYGNNWGPTAHPAPTQGEPPGGFYITATTLKKILSSGDAECYAFSKWQGFPVRSLDWFI